MKAKSRGKQGKAPAEEIPATGTGERRSRYDSMMYVLRHRSTTVIIKELSPARWLVGGFTASPGFRLHSAQLQRTDE